MARYAIGDVQGCYDPLMRLLDRVQFDDQSDELWFVGDLINRGPQSLEVLRFIHRLKNPAVITLGNHDLHFLASVFAGRPWRGKDDNLAALLTARDAEELGHWLRRQKIIHHCPELGLVLCHAGIAPCWDLNQAKAAGAELEAVLSGDEFKDFLSKMYGNEPHCWSDKLKGYDRLRLITNFFTRMRLCDAKGCLDLGYKGPLASKPANLYPWYEVPVRKKIEEEIIFGHWAALEGRCPDPRIHALDTGCLWGGPLTALRLEDRQLFQVAGLSNHLPLEND